MKNIFIDESGYTGADLLNTDQPFQAAASVKINEDEAEKLVNEFFPRRQSLELKHKKLSKRKSNWKPLLEIQKILLNEFMGFSYICDKKFLLILRFIDDCMEPFAYKNGIDFYQDGHNYALASLIYYTAPTLWGEKNFENLLFYYQNASKEKSNFSISQLSIHAQKIQGRELFEYLVPISMEDIDCINEIKNNNNNNDISSIILFGLISHLEKYITNSYQIIHDTSKNLLAYNEHIETFINIEEDIEFKLTNITKIKFPLKLTGVDQRDSKSSYGVQLADILVGGIVEHFWSLKGLISKTEYNENINELYSDTNLLHILPSINIDEDKNFRENSQSAELIDFIAEKFKN